ncbi:MAG: hypothetical protein KAI74_07885 [Kiritimatiellae bacterium]|nr:hypothetical protein [Kiritimatiellia bacterium]
MKTTKHHYKRKEVFSNPAVQSRIMITFLFLTLLFVITNFFISQRLLSAISSQIMKLPLSPENSTDAIIIMSQQGSTTLIQMGVFIFLSVFVMLMSGIILSHRIGGPIYQLHKYFDDMSENKIKPRKIVFRKNDFFHELTDSFNKFQVSQKILNDDNNSLKTDN